MLDREIRPRVHAVNLIMLEDIEERRKYLEEKVPEKFREWVMDYVRAWWPRREAIRKAERELRGSPSSSR